MEEGLSRYELGVIKQLHDRQHYTCVSHDYLAQQLIRIGLPSDASRFEVAERAKEIEVNMGRIQK